MLVVKVLLLVGINGIVEIWTMVITMRVGNDGFSIYNAMVKITTTLDPKLGYYVYWNLLVALHLVDMMAVTMVA